YVPAVHFCAAPRDGDIPAKNRTQTPIPDRAVLLVIAFRSVCRSPVRVRCRIAHPAFAQDSRKCQSSTALQEVKGRYVRQKTRLRETQRTISTTAIVSSTLRSIASATDMTGLSRSPGVSSSSELINT